MKLFRLLFFLLVVFAVLCGGGLLWFKHKMEYYNTLALPKDVKADAVVVLTGGTNRIAEGVKLMEEGYAQYMLISGVGTGVGLKDLLESKDIPIPEDSTLQERITIGHVARSTYGNAAEVAEWMRLRKFKTMVLVTSNYHMPRALLELGSAMPTVTILPYAVSPDMVQLAGWWKHPGTRKLILGEYIKFLGSSLRQDMENRQRQQHSSEVEKP